MKRILVIALLVVAAAVAFGQDIKLPAPKARAGMDLFDAINARSVTRGPVKHELPLADLSTILWAANGAKPVDAVSAASKAGRTIPYSGDIAYINVYFLNEQGIYLYVPESNLLKQVSNKDARETAVPGTFKTAAGMLLFTYDFAKTPRFLRTPAIRESTTCTAAFAAQNAALAAATLGIDSIVMYNMKQDEMAGAAKLTKDEPPLFIMQIGYRK
jgi:hypothetical protein